MKLKIKRSDINHMARFFGFSQKPVRSIVALLCLGISIGVAYEEMVGIGTWHKFHPDMDKLNICFTPPSGCESLVAQEISKANKNIYVQAYGLTSAPIIYQLKAAYDRGVQVAVLLDGGGLSNNEPVYQDLKNAGISVSMDKMPGIAHNKVMIIDDVKVITGSFNFTGAANTKNAENLLLIEDAEVADRYFINWQNRKANSTHP